jgi:hypothetical protein
MHDVRVSPCIRASNDAIRYITEELLDITTQYATCEAATGVVHTPSRGEVVPSSSPAAPSNVVAQCAKKGGRSGTLGGLWLLPKYVAKCDFNCEMQSPIDHFNRLLDVACLNHAYPMSG